MSFLPNNASVGYVAGLGHTLYKTTDGGLNWVQYAFQNAPDFFDIKIWAESGGDGIAGILVGQGGAVYQKTTSSSQWNAVTDSVVTSNTEDLNDVEIVSSGGTHLRIAGANGVVLFRDSSGSWSAPKSQASTYTLLKMAFQDTTHGFGIGSNFIVLDYN